MPLNPSQLTALKSELVNDPVAMGYSSPRNVGAHNLLTALVNSTTTTDIKRTNVSSGEIVEAIDVADIVTTSPTDAAQNQLQERYLSWLKSLAGLGDRMVRLQNNDGTLTPVGHNLDVMFPATENKPTRARIIALMTKKGTRAEVLFGAGTVVTLDEVTNALKLP